MQCDWFIGNGYATLQHPSLHGTATCVYAARRVEGNQPKGKSISNLHELKSFGQGLIESMIERTTRPSGRGVIHFLQIQPQMKRLQTPFLSMRGSLSSCDRLESSLELSPQKWASLCAPQVVLPPVIRNRGPPSERHFSFIPKSDHHHFRQSSLTPRSHAIDA